MESDVLQEQDSVLRSVALYLGLDIDVFCRDSQVTLHCLSRESNSFLTLISNNCEYVHLLVQKRSGY